MANKTYSVLLAVVVVLSAVGLFLFPRWTVDDAYIYYRYANNWVATGEPLWNIGEPPVEGFTGIGLLLLLVMGGKLGLSPLVTSHAVGLFSYLAGLLASILLARQLFYRFGQIILPLLYTATTILFTHAWSGLETMLFFALVLSMLVCFSHALVSDKKRYKIILALLGVAVSLTRPEGVVLTGSIFLTALVLHFKNRRTFIEYLSYGFIFYAIPFGIYWLVRYNYFGVLLPNTFYVKGSKGFSLTAIQELARFTFNFYKPTLVVVVGAVLLFYKKIKISVSSHSQKKSFWPVFFSAALFSAILLIQYSGSHLTMNYAYRFYVPLLPAFWIVLVYVLDTATHDLVLSRKLRFMSLAASIACLVGVQGYISIQKYKEESSFAENEERMLQETHAKMGEYVKQVVPPNEKLVVYIDAGATPFYAGLPTIDYGGLNSSILARELKTTPERVEYFFANNPGAAALTSAEDDSYAYTEEAESIVNDPRFTKKYTLVKKYLWREKNQPYNQFLYIRNDLLLKTR